MFLLIAGCNLPFFGEDPVAARVGLRYLRCSEINQALGENAEPQAREQFIENWIDRQLWDIEAKKHIRTDRVLRQQINDYRSSLLVNKYRERFILNKIMIGENDVLKYYDEHKTEFVAIESAAFIGLYVCSGKSAADDVLSALNNSETPAVPVQLKLVYKNSCVKPLDEKIFSKNARDFIGPVVCGGVFYVVSVLEKYPKNSLLRVEHVRKDIIQKLLMTEYTNVLQQKQKELKDRINVKIIKNTDN
ncbi:MAG: hypothetical protein U9O95_05330 [Candidatus Marinimicrobia bacterium]|nr:hypothetical protein [Candidatus Neomarinimicrobiota bacterium]